MQKAVFILVLLIGIDTLTGMIKSTKWFCGGFSSTRMFNGRKMITYALALILFYVLSQMDVYGFGDTFVYIACWLSLREAWSVVENLSDMGLQLPQTIIKKIVGEVKQCQPKNNGKSNR
jgi:toxin secretion/phage lysis holin